MEHSVCFRLTNKGRASLVLLATGALTMDWVSSRGQDVLELCGTPVSLQHLRQCMPPRSLDESLRSLLALGLIEQHDVHAQDAGNH